MGQALFRSVLRDYSPWSAPTAWYCPRASGIPSPLLSDETDSMLFLKPQVPHRFRWQVNNPHLFSLPFSTCRLFACFACGALLHCSEQKQSRYTECSIRRKSLIRFATGPFNALLKALSANSSNSTHFHVSFIFGHAMFAHKICSYLCHWWTTITSLVVNLGDWSVWLTCWCCKTTSIAVRWHLCTLILVL